MRRRTARGLAAMTVWLAVVAISPVSWAASLWSEAAACCCCELFADDGEPTEEREFTRLMPCCDRPEAASGSATFVPVVPEVATAVVVPPRTETVVALPLGPPKWPLPPAPDPSPPPTDTVVLLI